MVPSAALGLEFGSYAYRLLLRWWLGAELVITDDEKTPVCPFCHGPTDVFGDHFLCCNKYEFHSRHEAVVSMKSHFLRAAGLRVQNEIGIQGRQRPADIFLDHWAGEDPVAVDVVITHPLAPSLGVSVRAAKGALKEKEKRKEAKYQQLFVGHQISFIPFAMSSFGAFGQHAAEFVDGLVKAYAGHQDEHPSVCHQKVVQSIQVAMMQEIGKRLVCALAVLDEDTTLSI